MGILEEQLLGEQHFRHFIKCVLLFLLAPQHLSQQGWHYPWWSGVCYGKGSTSSYCAQQWVYGPVLKYMPERTTETTKSLWVKLQPTKNIKETKPKPNNPKNHKITTKNPNKPHRKKLLITGSNIFSEFGGVGLFICFLLNSWLILGDLTIVSHILYFSYDT